MLYACCVHVRSMHVHPKSMHVTRNMHVHYIIINQYVCMYVRELMQVHDNFMLRA